MTVPLFNRGAINWQLDLMGPRSGRHSSSIGVGTVTRIKLALARASGFSVIIKDEDASSSSGISPVQSCPDCRDSTRREEISRPTTSSNFFDNATATGRPT